MGDFGHITKEMCSSIFICPIQTPLLQTPSSPHPPATIAAKTPWNDTVS